MTQMDLLEAIGCVDESLLAESEATDQCRPILWRVLLVAAIGALLGIAVGAASLVSVPINNAEIEGQSSQGGFVSIIDHDSGDIAFSGALPTVDITMDFTISPDVTEGLRQGYVPQVPENWRVKSVGRESQQDCLQSFTITWYLPGYGEEAYFQYRQRSAYEYNGLVDSLTLLPGGGEITMENTCIGDYSVLRVTIPKQQTVLEYGELALFYDCMPEGEKRLYWSDGCHIFSLRYPMDMSDEEVLAILESLCPQENISEYLDGLQSE